MTNSKARIIYVCNPHHDNEFQIDELRDRGYEVYAPGYEDDNIFLVLDPAIKAIETGAYDLLITGIILPPNSEHEELERTTHGMDTGKLLLEFIRDRGHGIPVLIWEFTSPFKLVGNIELDENSPTGALTLSSGEQIPIIVRNDVHYGEFADRVEAHPEVNKGRPAAVPIDVPISEPVGPS